MTIALGCALAMMLAAPQAEWRVTGGDAGATRYSPLDGINRANVARLRVAWIYHTGDKLERPKTTIECTPIVVGGVMYVTSPRMKAIALDAATGKPRWVYDPTPPRTPAPVLLTSAVLVLLAGFAWRRRRRAVLPLVAAGLIGGRLFVVFGDKPFDPWDVNRGVTYWQSGRDKRILYVAGHRLIALDATTGRPIRSFGDGGAVDLRRGLGRSIGDMTYTVTSPGVVYRDLIIVGSKVGEGPVPAAPGDVRAFDVRTGAQRWTFHTVPRPGEPGHDTWLAGSWKNAGGVNDWGGMSVDQKRGLVFLALGAPSFDFYGGQRPGENLYGDSIVALEAATGRRVWHFQTIHHDLWDYDLPAAPTLVTVQHDGRAVDAVALASKSGFVFVLDRGSGRPLFPIEERPVPATDAPGDRAWPTQPFPLKPPPLSRQSLTEADLTDLSPQAHAYALGVFRSVRAAGIFIPPSLRGIIESPGLHGGANWSGGAFDPETGWFYVNSNDIPYLVKLVPSKPWASYPYAIGGFDRFLDPQGYPAVKPPWGRLNAINLNTGEFAWRVPLGEYPELAAHGIPRTGTENFGGAIVTAGGLVFIGATRDEQFRAFDKSTGRLLWQTQLEAGGYATPCTYAAGGRQFVAIAAGGGGQLGTRPGDAFVAFAVPR